MDDRSPEEVWEERLGRLLTVEEASALVGSSAELAELEASGAVIALTRRSGNRCYPSRQFIDGRPIPGVAAAHRRMSEVVSPWTAASFALGGEPHPALDGLSVREWAASGRSLDHLMLVAERDAAPLAH
jgi:hypothetical protein